MTNQEAEEIIRAAAEKLGEHFDAVQILATWPNESGGTRACFRGCGNYYARQGMAHDFIEEDRANTMAEKIKPQEDE